MADPAKNINYSASDIARYLGTQMTVSEMHEIERAALQDAFLADAIDGYRDSNFAQSKKHLNEITAALYAKKEDSKIIPIQSNKNIWFRIAALIILLAGVGAAGWYFLSIQNNQQSNINVAQVKAEKADTAKSDSNLKQQEKSTIVSTNPDSERENGLFSNSESTPVEKSGNGKAEISGTGGSSGIPLNMTPENNKNFTFGNHKDSKAKKTLDATPSSDQALLETVALAPSVEKSEDAISGKVAGVSLSKNKESKSALKNTFKGRITDNQKKPIPFATILLTDSKTSSITDTDGFFKIAAADSTVNIAITAIGFESKKAQINANSDTTIPLRPDFNGLSEVVVTGYGANKSTTIITKHEGLIPRGGWPSFERYLNQQLNNKTDAEEDATIIRGTFEIAFSIDNTGKPDSISVLNSPDEKANILIIDLIKNGPRWIGDKKNKKGSIIFRFQ